MKKKLTQEEEDYVIIQAIKFALDDGDNFFFETEEKDELAREYLEKLIKQSPGLDYE